MAAKVKIPIGVFCTDNPGQFVYEAPDQIDDGKFAVEFHWVVDDNGYTCQEVRVFMWQNALDIERAPDLFTE